MEDSNKLAREANDVAQKAYAMAEEAHERWQLTSDAGQGAIVAALPFNWQALNTGPGIAYDVEIQHALLREPIRRDQLEPGKALPFQVRYNPVQEHLNPNLANAVTITWAPMPGGPKLIRRILLPRRR